METREHDVEHDRRRDEGLVFDAVQGRLTMGANGTDLPSGGGNREVLEVYVDLVARCRGRRPDTLLEVRAEDIAGLSAALDLDADDLRLQIEEVLAVDTDQAVGLLIRLLQHRLVVGAAAAAAGVVAVGALALGGSAGSAGAEPVRPTPAVTDVAAPTATPDEGAPVVDGPLVVTDDGVGLIPPVQQDRDGTVLVPAAQVDAEPATPATTTPTPAAEQVAPAQSDPDPTPVEAAPPGSTPASFEAGPATVQVEAAQVDAPPVIDGPLVVTPDGVGLIPAVQQDPNGTVLIPAEQVDADGVQAVAVGG